jgi:nitroreductase
MNEIIDAIRARRTVKRMDAGRSPPRAEIEAVIEAAAWAPNHHMTEPWRFVVLEKDARRRLGVVLADALAGAAAVPVPAERLEKEREKPLSSPVVIALIGSPGRGENIVPQEELVAAGAALQNMLLAAHSLGLATSVRTGPHSYSPEVKSFFGMAEPETLIGMVYLGYASGAVPPGRRSPLREKVAWLTD